MHGDPLHDEIDDTPDELDDETLERVAAERRRLPGETGDDEPDSSYEEEPGMGEDEHGEQPSR